MPLPVPENFPANAINTSVALRPVRQLPTVIVVCKNTAVVVITHLGDNAENANNIN